jgi:hypothetical protein
MTKYSLLIGINYRGTSSELNGCINDVQNMKLHLTTSRGVPSENITILTEDSGNKPTGMNIIHEITKLVSKPDATELWLHYSGHGSHIVDTSGDEKDGRDETIVPLDYETAGMITDDMLQVYISKVPAPVQLYCIFDCCHSGTVMDLRYMYKGANVNSIENTNSKIIGKVLMISGCKDTETSADAYINGKYAGAMTASYLSVMANHNNVITCQQLIDEMRSYMIHHKYGQRPQLCSSYKLDTTTNF